MKTLEQIKNFTPKQRNEFIDEMIDMLEKYWESTSIVGSLEYLTDAQLTRTAKRPFIDALSINLEQIANTFGSKEHTLNYLKSIKTAE